MTNTLLTNLFVSLLLTSQCFSEPVLLKGTTFEEKSEDEKEESIIIQHKDVKITVGGLEIYAPFIYQGEVSPKQGYLVSIKDTILMKDLVMGCENSYKSLIEVIKEDYNKKLILCQEKCEERINLIVKENHLLRKDIQKLNDKVSSEITQKYILTAISLFGEIGIGYLTFQIIN